MISLYLLNSFKKTSQRVIFHDSNSKRPFAPYTDCILSLNMSTVRNTGLLFTFTGARVRFTVRRHDSSFIMQLACQHASQQPVLTPFVFVFLIFSEHGKTTALYKFRLSRNNTLKCKPALPQLRIYIIKTINSGNKKQGFIEHSPLSPPFWSSV